MSVQFQTHLYGVLWEVEVTLEIDEDGHGWLDEMILIGFYPEGDGPAAKRGDYVPQLIQADIQCFTRKECEYIIELAMHEYEQKAGI